MKGMSSSRRPWAIAAFAAAAIGGQDVQAQDSAAQSSNTDSVGLEEVVVTAQRRSENLQRVPITVSSVDADSLANARAAELNDIAKLVPGFRGGGDSATSTPHLRGIGNLSISAGNDSAVSYYIDGVYIPTTLTGLVSIKNAARVEVLKGPQGTLFGRNATAGLVQIVSRSPSQQLELETEVGYANYDTSSVSGYVAGPLGDGLGANLSVSGSWQGDGWGTNIYDGGDVRRIDSDVAARGGLFFELGENTELVLRGDYQKTEATGSWAFRIEPSPANTALGTYSIGDNRWNANSDVVPDSEGKNWGVSATLTHDLGFATLMSITAYRDHSLAVPQLDFDGTPIPGLQLDNLQTATQLSQELQLASNVEGALTWTAGLFYFDGEDGSDSDLIVGPLLQPANGNLALNGTRGRQDTESLAAYAQGDYEFGTGTTLTLGARYTEETRNLHAPSFLVFSDGSRVTLPTQTDEITARVPTWRVALGQDLSEDVRAYASVSKGFKSGGYNLANAFNPAFDPEELIAYEVGTKATLLERRLRLNASVFYYDYTDIQVSAFDTNSGSLQQLYNAAAAEFYGLDLDFDARLTHNLTLSGGLELLHGEYTDFPSAILTSPGPGGFGFNVGSGDATGNTTAQSPELSGTLVATYDVDINSGRLTLSADANYNSGYFFEADNRAEQDAYTLLGASIRYSLPGDNFYVQLWGKNLGNEAIRALYLTSAIAAVSHMNAPRTYGVSAGYRF